MLNNRQLLFLGVVVLALLVFFILQNPAGKKKFDWRETYKEKSIEPYGSHLFKEFLASYFPNDELTVIKDSINGQLPLDGNGLFVSQGPSMYLRDSDLDHLLEFVKAGGDAFLSCQYFPYDIMFYMYFEPCNDYYWNGQFFDLRDSIVTMNFEHPNLKKEGDDFEFRYVFRNEGQTRYWNYFDEAYFCEQDSGLLALGRMEGHAINFARVAMGKGHFYLHTNPITFTNYNLLTRDGQDYLERIMSHFSEGPIYWDEYSRQPESIVRAMEGNGGGGSGIANDDRLRFILSNPPLAWAWYLLLGMALVYLWLNTKRRQRVVPVLEPNNNTSLEYLNTIGRLYFLHNDHKQLAKQQAKLWRQHLWQEYGLRPKMEEHKMAAMISHRSGRPLAMVEKLLGLYHSIESAKYISEETMVNFHQQLEGFYHFDPHANYSYD